METNGNGNGNGQLVEYQDIQQAVITRWTQLRQYSGPVWTDAKRIAIH